MNPENFPPSKWCIYSRKAFVCGASVYIYQNPITKEKCRCTFITTEKDWKEEYPWDDAVLVATGPIVPVDLFASWVKKKKE